MRSHVLLERLLKVTVAGRRATKGGTDLIADGNRRQQSAGGLLHPPTQTMKMGSAPRTPPEVETSRRRGTSRFAQSEPRPTSGGLDASGPSADARGMPAGSPACSLAGAWGRTDGLPSRTSARLPASLPTGPSDPMDNRSKPYFAAKGSAAPRDVLLSPCPERGRSYNAAPGAA